MAYKIVNMWVPKSKYNIKATYAMNPLEICVHNTANVAPARSEVAYMRRNNNMTSYHVAVDNREVVQTIPFNRNAWAAGDGANGRGNRRAIHIEICYSMDNGYSGAKSSRYREAEENAALYIAHILKQYGWGTNKLRQHYDYSRKDCPHKMRAHNSWGQFKNRVQAHLNALNGKTSSSSSKKKSTPKKTTSSSSSKITGSTYKVKKGDSLWAISKASGVSVNNLKSYNNLSSDTIKVGQTLRLTKPAAKKSSSSSSKSSSSRKTGGAGNIKYNGDWRFNKNTGVYWVPVKAKYKLAYDTYAYDKVPKIIRANRLSKIKAGTTIDVVELCRFVEPNNKQSYVWAVYRTGKGRLRYLPIKKWNKFGGKLTNSGLFGQFLKV